MDGFLRRLPAGGLGMTRAVETFGRFRVSIEPGGDVIVLREGIIGRGDFAVFRAWSVEQVTEALGWARVRRGHLRDARAKADAICECKALEWALQQLRAREAKVARNE